MGEGFSVVFLAGIARAIVLANWICAIAGGNTAWAKLIGVLFGVFVYFSTRGEAATLVVLVGFLLDGWERQRKAATPARRPAARA